MNNNYVVACYMGERANEDPRYVADRAFFMKEHVASLVRLKHSLAQITVVCSGGDPTGYLASLPKTLGGAPVEILHRENVGLSYGGFSDALEKYKDAFDNYIFTEDDYIFTYDHFDALLETELTTRPRCGMLCAAAYGQYGDGMAERNRHAGVFMGICRTEALMKARSNVFSAELRLPRGQHPSNAPVLDRMEDGYLGQKTMSFAIVDAGYELDDWLVTWSTAYWTSEPGLIRWFGKGPTGQIDPLSARGDLTRPSFIAPIQALDVANVRLSDRFDWHYGTLDRQGVWHARG